jgi:DNA-binding IclR family transcriptional regulator
LIRRAHEVVGRISSACGHTGYVSVRDGAEITAVTDHPGANHLRVVSNIGRRFPAFASAVGRASLARLSDQEVRQLYAAGLTPPTPKAPQSVDELIERLAVVRRTGVAVSHEEMTPGVIAMAAAVADPETGEEASLCIVFPAVSANESQRDSIARALREGVHEIALARRIGFDIGGTFTDFILYDGARSEVTLHKALTTPHDPSVAALEGLNELVAMRAISLADVSRSCTARRWSPTR